MKALTCIVCPNGCRIESEYADGDYRFSGHACARGEAYARSELTQPMRTLCTTVRSGFPGVPALPVRTSAPVPKERIPELMRALSGARVDRRVGVGDVVLPRVLGLDCDMLCTSDILRETERRI